MEKQQGDAPLWRCGACGAANPNAQRACQACGAKRPGGNGRPRLITVTDGYLAEINTGRLAAIRSMSYRQMLGATLSEAELREYARARGYHPWWVKHRLREQQRGDA
jgi:hypothetical protein